MLVVGVVTRDPRLEETADELPTLSAEASFENLRADDTAEASGPSRELRRDSGSRTELLEPRLTLANDDSPE